MLCVLKRAQAKLLYDSFFTKLRQFFIDKYYKYHSYIYSILRDSSDHIRDLSQEKWIKRTNSSRQCLSLESRSENPEISISRSSHVKRERTHRNILTINRECRAFFSDVRRFKYRHSLLPSPAIS